MLCGYFMTFGSYAHMNGGWSAHATTAVPPVLFCTTTLVDRVRDRAAHPQVVERMLDVFMIMPMVWGWSFLTTLTSGALRNCL